MAPYLSENAPKNEADASVLSEALQYMRQAVQRTHDTGNDINQLAD